MATPSKIWKRTRRRKTPDQVGAFFEKVASHLWTSATASTEADLEAASGEISILIEVKACGSRSPRLAESQLDRYSSLAKFPFDAVFYVIFLYHNHRAPKRGAPRATKLSRCRTKKEVEQFVIRNCFSAFLLDHRLIEAIGHHHGSQTAVFPGDPEQAAIILTPTLLKQLVNEPTAAFQELGLQPAKWVSQSHEIVLPGDKLNCLVPIKFPLQVIAERKIAPAVGRLRNRSLFSAVKPAKTPVEV